MRSRPVPGRTLGWSAAEIAAKPYGRFWNPVLAPLPSEAVEALHRGPVAEPLLPRLQEAPHSLFGPGPVLETGYTLNSDGGISVAVRTVMPGVSPVMWDWWFGWHGEEALRYKLWHPQAHIHAQWDDMPAAGTVGRTRYIGRTSFVDEYIGAEMGRFAIRFVPPAMLGFNDPSLVSGEDGTIICARTGLGDYSIDAGYLAHHLRKVPGGCEMRSRFWIGGRHVVPRGGSILASAGVRLAGLFLKPKEADARNLLIHCAQEMQHLAAFLPELYAQESSRA